MVVWTWSGTGAQVLLVLVTLLVSTPEVPASTHQFPTWKVSACLLGDLWLQHAKPLEAAGYPWASTCMVVWKPESGMCSLDIIASFCIYFLRLAEPSRCCCGVAGGMTSPVCMQLGTRFGIHLTLEQWYRQYGPIYKFFLGRAPVVVVTGAHNTTATPYMCLHLQLQKQPRILSALSCTREHATPANCNCNWLCTWHSTFSCVSMPSTCPELHSHVSVLSMQAVCSQCHACQS